MNPSDRTRIATYYDAFLPHLKHDHEHENARLGHVKVKLGKYIKPGMTVLDLGCGTGLTSKFMAQLGAKVTAVDISPKLIEFARKESAHKNVEYAVGDITSEPELTSGDLKFDGIVLVDVFEHIPAGEIYEVLSGIERHSHEKTWVFLNIPDARYQLFARQNFPDRLQIEDNGYFIDWLLDQFGEYDFEAVEIQIYGIDVPVQYNSFLFMRGNEIEEAYKGLMGG